MRQQHRMVLLERAGTRRASWISRRGNARRSYLDALTRGLQADGVEPGRDRASAVSRRGSHGVRILSVPEAALTSVEFLSALVVSEVSDAVGGPPGHGSSPKSGSRARRTWPSGHQFCTASRGPCRLSSGAPTFVIHDQRACSSASALGRWLVPRQRPHHRALHLRRSREPVTSSSVPWPLDLRLTHEARASLRPGAPAER